MPYETSAFMKPQHKLGAPHCWGASLYYSFLHPFMVQVLHVQVWGEQLRVQILLKFVNAGYSTASGKSELLHCSTDSCIMNGLHPFEAASPPGAFMCRVASRMAGLLHLSLLQSVSPLCSFLGEPLSLSATFTHEHLLWFCNDNSHLCNRGGSNPLTCVLITALSDLKTSL